LSGRRNNKSSVPLITTGWGFIRLPGEKAKIESVTRRFGELVASAVQPDQAEDFASGEPLNIYAEPVSKEDPIGTELVPDDPVTPLRPGVFAANSRSEVTWQYVAGSEPLERRRTWAALPSEVVDASSAALDPRFSVVPDGAPDDFTGVMVSIDVLGSLSGGFVQVADRTGSTYRMREENGTLQAFIPRGSLVLDDREQDPPIYQLSLEFSWRDY
jgi:hypothetical protein